jgi:nickel transport protein
VTRALFALALFALVFSCAAAHDLDHTIGHGEAIVVRFHYADGPAFSYESYEVYRPGETTPFQVGRTDALGRVAFVPDAGGEWRVRAFSEDGHGADLRVDAEASLASAAVPRAASERGVRVLLGVAIILGLFGAWGLYRSRRKQ